MSPPVWCFLELTSVEYLRFVWNWTSTMPPQVRILFFRFCKGQEKRSKFHLQRHGGADLLFKMPYNFPEKSHKWHEPKIFFIRTFWLNNENSSLCIFCFTVWLWTISMRSEYNLNWMLFTLIGDIKTLIICWIKWYSMNINILVPLLGLVSYSYHAKTRGGEGT